ncbi:MAG: sodium-dependent transporter [Lachnospiraceae bacterium]|nr:sodium-dependent transporter [Lachnospiraceae bacterium]
MEEKRESLGSRLGFILLSAGCAIGLGNVWGFPYKVGHNGGGAFVFVYIICVLLLGVPIMTAEFAMGRAARKSPVNMYRPLLKNEKSPFHLQGWLSLAGNFFLMMFYTTIAGYFFHYLIGFISGNMEHLTWGETVSNTGVNVGFMVLVVVLGFVILSFDIQKGLEKITKWMMLALFALMIVLAIHSCTLSGFGDGISFYLKPDFSLITPSVIIAAMCQAFFSLSLGMGSMAIFGSYTDKSRSLLGEAVNVCALDTLVALLAGFIIFPACFTFNINPDAGPPLLFTTMVTVFQNMSGGRIWGSLFFIFMIFAAMSTVVAVFENILAMMRELTGWSRKKGCFICCIMLLVLCTPMALTGNVLANVHPLGGETGFLDLWDFLVETVIQPLGSVLFLVVCCSDKLWGWDEFELEANTGKGLKVKSWMKVFFKYITPIIVFALWIYGLVTFF